MPGFFSSFAARLRGRPGPQTSLKSYPLWPVWGWTLERIAGALAQHDLGNWEWSSLLGMAMLKDDRIRSGLEVLASAVADVEFELLRCEDEPPEVAAALDHLEKVWRSVVFADSTERQVVKDVTMSGVKAAQETWAVVGDYWTPTVRPWPTGRLRFAYDLGSYAALTVDGPVPVPMVGDGREWLVFRASEDQPWIDAAVRPLALPFYSKGQANRGWLGYAAVHGQPQRLVKHPYQQREQEDVKRLVKKVADAVNGSTVPLPQGKGPNGEEITFSVDLLEAKADTFKCFPDLIAVCDAAETIILLSQTETTGGEQRPGGSRAKAEVQERQFDKVTVAKVAVLQEGLRALCRAYLRANLLDEQWAPEPYYETKEETPPHLVAEGEVKRAGALASYVKSLPELDKRGAKVDVVALARRLGVPLLGDNPAEPKREYRRPVHNHAGRMLRATATPLRARAATSKAA